MISYCRKNSKMQMGSLHNFLQFQRPFYANTKCTQKPYHWKVVLKLFRKCYIKRCPCSSFLVIGLIYDRTSVHMISILYCTAICIERESQTVTTHSLRLLSLFFVKKMLAGCLFNSRSAPGSAEYKCLQSVPRADYSMAFGS